jgi:hypothetical protein
MFNIKFSKSLVAFAVASSLLMGGCTRVTDGETGVRVMTSGTIAGTELDTGYHQTLFGNILQFPIRDITYALDNQQPLTSDNSALADFDVSIVYSINKTAVSELYKTKARSFHLVDEKTKDTYLMYNYIGILVNNAVYKAVREYKSLEVADNRAKIEQEIKRLVFEQLKAEKLDTSILLSVVQVRSIKPNAAILASATELVKSQNDLKIKENEIKIAEAESKRQSALSQNSGAAIAYMDAQARLTIAEAVKNGKVQTIIVPSNMTSLMMSK